MSRKRLIKLLMGVVHMQRNEAAVLADACGEHFSHAGMFLCAAALPELCAAARLCLPAIRQGATLTIAADPGGCISGNLMY